MTDVWSLPAAPPALAEALLSVASLAEPPATRRRSRAGTAPELDRSAVSAIVAQVAAEVMDEILGGRWQPPPRFT